MNQVTRPDRTDTVSDDNKQRPFELILPHEYLDQEGQKRPHVPEEALGRDQNQGHATRRIRIRRGHLGHRPLNDGEMVSEIIMCSCYAISHGPWGYGAPVGVQLHRQTGRAPMVVEWVRERSYRR